MLRSLFGYADWLFRALCFEIAHRYWLPSCCDKFVNWTAGQALSLDLSPYRLW